MVPQVVWGRSSLLGFFLEKWEGLERRGREASGEIAGGSTLMVSSPCLPSCPEPTAPLLILPAVQLCLAAAPSARP